MEEIFSVFVQEAREQLTAMENALLRMEQGDGDADLLNAVFRAAHTIKGGAGVMELDHIERFTHTLENLLDRLRNGELHAGSEMITLLLKSCDHIHALLEILEQGCIDEDPTLAEAGRCLTDGLHAFGETAGSTTTGTALPVIAAQPSTTDCWHISIRFDQNVLKMGMDPLNFLRYLQKLGRITHITTLCDALPATHDFHAETCYLGFEIRLHSSTGKHEIEDVFSFCRDECELYILPPDSRVADYLQMIERLPEDTMYLGEILVRAGALTREELDTGLQRQARSGPIYGQGDTSQGSPPTLSEARQPETVEAAATQKQARTRGGGEARLLRVQADKLDQLIDLVGELVIAGASASLLARQSGQSQLVEANAMISRLIEDIRDSTLQLRMVQIGETFNRFNRVVRDTAHELGKDIELVISGAETELDKSVVERIGDPLMHLMRNAIDHGIESAEARQAAGKPVRGRLELKAFHDSGNVIIEVIDDGGGIDIERIRSRAIERGLIQADHALTEQEAVNLVFEAGFSTNRSVTTLSGRGVGMDVVKRNIEALRGSIEVATWAGRGSCFTLRLPLTLAIIDGFLTMVGQASYVVPLSAVVECLELKADDTRGHMLDLRGEVLPFIRLRDFFSVDDPPPVRENIVVVTAGGVKAGIVVDQLQGEFQTVIKPLGRLFRHLRGIGGSTILGSGTVALILDVQALIQLAIQREEASFSVARLSSHSSAGPAPSSHAPE